MHGEPVERAVAGQRVAVSVTGPGRRGLERGDVLAAPSGDLAPSYRLDAELDFDHESETAAARVQIHHGTRQSAARIVPLGERLVQLRLEAPLIALPGDRFVVRRIAPPATLGGGRIIDQDPRRHGPIIVRGAAPGARRRSRADPPRRPRPGRGSLPADPATWRTQSADRPCARAPSPGALAAGRRDPRRGPTGQPRCRNATRRGRARTRQTGERAGGAARPHRGRRPRPARFARPATGTRCCRRRRAQPAPGRVDDAVDSLIDAGLLVRLRGEVLYPASRLDAIVGQVRRLLDDRGEITLAGLRDELAITRKYSQAILEHVDRARDHRPDRRSPRPPAPEQGRDEERRGDRLTIRRFDHGAAGVWWPIRPSKPAGRCSPSLGRFDSFAASYCGGPWSAVSAG